MILVSFFSEDNVLSDEIKICCILEYQSNENRAFRFLGKSRYTHIDAMDQLLLHIRKKNWICIISNLDTWMKIHNVITLPFLLKRIYEAEKLCC